MSLWEKATPALARTVAKAPLPLPKAQAQKRKGNTGAEQKGKRAKGGAGGTGSSSTPAGVWFSMSTGGKQTTVQPETVQQKKGQEKDGDPALAFETVEEMELNFPFTLPEVINEGRTEEEAEEVKKVLEEAHHTFLTRQKHIDDLIRKRVGEIGSTYTLEHQLRFVGNSAETWLQKVGDWQEEEKWAMTAITEELEKLKKKNPLVKLLLNKSAAVPEPTTQAAKPSSAVRRGRKRKQVVMEEESEEEEEQLYMAELDTFVPVNMIGFAFGDPIGNEEPMEE